MDILVTGGAGFIGAATANALNAAGHTVTVVDDLSSGDPRNLDKGIVVIIADVRDPTRLPTKIDVIYHFAAQVDVRAAIDNPHPTIDVNVTGTSRMLAYARKASAKQFIFASSGATIYGHVKPPQTVHIPEDPRCPYSLSKFTAEQLLHQHARFYGMRFVVLRYTNVYGPGQDGSRECGVIGVFTRQAKQGKPITVFGGSQTRDFVHIDDVVRANLAALDEVGTFNISTGVPTTIDQLATKIKEMSGVTIHHQDHPFEEVIHSCAIPTKMKDWRPKIQLVDGLRELLKGAPIPKIVSA